MKHLSDKWWHWLQQVTFRLFHRKHYRSIRIVELRPDDKDIADNEILFVGTKESHKWAMIRCPCGCGEVIHVNLMRTHSPHWSAVIENKNDVTFRPSLWIDRSRCGSHFFVVRGRVVWAKSLMLMNGPS